MTTHRRGIVRRTVHSVMALGLLAVGLAGCDSDRVPGGAADLPGSLPSGVSFAPPQDDAAAAPALTVELVDGTTVNAEDLWADRAVVLVFTASWCSTCAEIHREVAAEVDERDGAVTLLAVLPEDDEGAEQYAADLDLGHPVGVASDDLWLDYAVREPPLVGLVAPGGRLLRGWPGGPGDDVLAEQLDLLVIESTP